MLVVEGRGWTRWIGMWSCDFDLYMIVNYSSVPELFAIRKWKNQDSGFQDQFDDINLD
jgi:hypothetical protein